MNVINASDYAWQRQFLGQICWWHLLDSACFQISYHTGRTGSQWATTNKLNVKKLWDDCSFSINDPCIPPSPARSGTCRWTQNSAGIMSDKLEFTQHIYYTTAAVQRMPLESSERMVWPVPNSGKCIRATNVAKLHLMSRPAFRRLWTNS